MKNAHRVQLPVEKWVRAAVLDDGGVDSHYWCIHCERTYPAGLVWLTPDGRQLCPYGDCDGDTVFDSLPWRSMRAENPDLPEVPVWGVAYPQWA